MVRDIAQSRLKVKLPDSLPARQIQEIDYGLKNQINEAFLILINSEREEMRSSSDSTNRIFTIVLILYVISLAIFYAVWAFPMANRFNTEVATANCRSKSPSRCSI